MAAIDSLVGLDGKTIIQIVFFSGDEALSKMTCRMTGEEFIQHMCNFFGIEIAFIPGRQSDELIAHVRHIT